MLLFPARLLVFLSAVLLVQAQTVPPTTIVGTPPPLVAGQTENATAAPLVPATAAPLAPNGANATAPPLVTAPPTPLATQCTSSEQCGDGFFCSGTGQCMPLNCASWAASPPSGEKPYSEEPCVAEQATEGTAFCGWDGNCYEYNCQNWYTYGPVEFTGYDPANPVQLTCSDYATGAVDNMNSVTFGCRPWQPGNKAPESKSWTHFFNQECKATPRATDDFKCYQNKPGTDYADFQGAVARLNPPSCDQEIYENEQPLYWYILMARQDRKGQVTNYKQGRGNTLNGDSFNANLADKTFYSVILSNGDAPVQTFPPPATLAPTESSAPMVASLTAALWMAIVSLFLI